MKKWITGIILAVLFLGTFAFIFIIGNNDGGNNTDEPKDENVIDAPYAYNLDEYITIANYPDVKIDETRVKELVDGTLAKVAENFAEKKEITDRPVKEGDTVNIDYVGTLDGVAFEGGTAKGADLVIGSDSYIDGFEDGLVGKNIGEEVVLELKFPEPYQPNPDLAGKPTVFTVTINKITETITPEVTDEHIAQLKSDNYKTVEEFKAYYTKLATRTMAWECLVEGCTAKKYPEKEVNEYVQKMIESYTQQAAAYGMELANFLSMMGTSLEAFTADVRVAAQENVKAEMIVYQIVRKHNIQVSEQEYQTIGLEYATSNGLDSLAAAEESIGKDVIMLNVYQKKIVAAIVAANEG